MFLLLVATAVYAEAVDFVPPKERSFPPTFLSQFPDYDLIVHFDTSTHPLLDFLSQKSTNRHAVHLLNYNANPSTVRPRGYKYINVVILGDAFRFQEYSLAPYNLHQFDFVLFITRTVQGTRIWQMGGLKRAAAVFVYDLEKTTIFHCCYHCGNATAVLKEVGGVNLRSLLNDYSNFRGHVFRIGYANFPPFFWKGGGDGRPGGAEGTLLHEFSRFHNFRYELIEFKSEPGRGAWQALVEAVEEDAIDWAVGGLSVSLKRGAFTDFTRFIKTQGFSVAYFVYQSTWVEFESILLVFEWLVWVAIACTIVGICLIATLANKSLGLQGFGKYAKVALLAIAEQGATRHQMKLVTLSTVRTVFSIWWLTSLILTTMYKSQLASSLIKPKYNQPDRIDDLVDNDFSFQANKEDWSVLKENLESSSDKVYARVLGRIDDSLDFCNSVLALKGRRLAVIDEETALQHDVFTRCTSIGQLYRSSLRLVTQNIFPSTYHAWSMPMGTPFRLKFSKTIGKMDDYGLIDHWYQSASLYHLPRSHSRTEAGEALPLTPEQFLPALVVLGIGCGAAAVVLMIELCVN